MIQVAARPSLFGDLARQQIEVKLADLVKSNTAIASEVISLQNKLTALQTTNSAFKDELHHLKDAVSTLELRIGSGTLDISAEVNDIISRLDALEKPAAAVESMVLSRKLAAEARFSAKATKSGRVFYHSGNFGDIVFALPAIAYMGGGTLLLGTKLCVPTRIGTTSPMTHEAVNNIAPLLLKQPYILRVAYTQNDPGPSVVNLNRFRILLENALAAQSTWTDGLSLYRLHLAVCGITNDDETVPWLLNIAPRQDKDGRDIAVACSSRYRDPQFPWKQLVGCYGGRMFFLGTSVEWETFCAAHGKVPHFPTENLLEVAEWIAGAKLFIGNQSCPLTIAEGLKKPTVQESCPQAPNSLFRRPDLMARVVNFDQIAKFVESVIGSPAIVPDISLTAEVTPTQAKPTLKLPDGLDHFRKFLDPESVNVLCPAGVGDVLWILAKWHSVAQQQKCTFWFPFGEQQRAGGLARMAGVRYGYLPGLTTSWVWKHPGNPKIPSEPGVVVVQANRHLETGNKLVNWYPGLPLKYPVLNATYTPTPEQYVIGFMCGRMYMGGNLRPETWAEICRFIEQKYAPVKIVGAGNDVDYAQAVFRHWKPSSPPMFDCPLEEVVGAIQSAAAVVGLASGILITAIVEGIPSVIAYPEWLRRMPGTWEPNSKWTWCFTKDIKGRIIKEDILARLI